MTARTTFASLSDGLKPVPSLLDQMFADIGACTIIPCLAAGTNAITLTELSNVPQATAYRTGLLFGFIAAATSSGSVTATFRALGAKPIYYQDGLTLIGTGDLRANQYYIVSYSSDLNSAAGGWYLINGPGSIVAVVGNGLIAKTSATTGAARTLTAPAAGFTITNGDGVAGNPTFVLANDLAALEALSSTGIAVRTASDTWAQRSLAASTGLLWTNASGVAGNPSVALDINALTVDGSPDGTADYVATYDASAAAHKKVLINTAVVQAPVVRYDAAQTLTAAQQSTVRTSISAALKGQYSGLTLSNNVSDATNDMDIAVGEAASTETNPVLMVLASILTKRLDAAWAVGTNQGGLDTGAIANDTYFIWLIRRSDTGVVDALYSLSPTAPTMPTSYDQKRRIGSIIRSAGAILPMFQIGTYFGLKTTHNSASGAAMVTANRTAINLLTPARVQVLAHISANLSYGSASAYGVVTSSDQTDNAAAAANFTNLVNVASIFSVSVMDVWVNTSGQVFGRVSHASATYDVNTFGWWDFL